MNGSTEKLCPGTAVVWWSADRTRAVALDTAGQLWVLSETGDAERAVGLDNQYSPYAGSWSPDGRRFAVYMERPGLDASGKPDCLLTILDMSKTPVTPIEAVPPPPGVFFERHSPPGWVGSSHLVVVLSDRPARTPETWVYAIPDG